MKTGWTRTQVVRLCIAALTSLGPGVLAHAQSGSSLPERIEAVMNRPEFAHSTFGIEFYSLDKGTVLYKLNPDKLLVPGSTTKLLTEGTVLELLGRSEERRVGKECRA